MGMCQSFWQMQSYLSFCAPCKPALLPCGCTHWELWDLCGIFHLQGSSLSSSCPGRKPVRFPGLARMPWGAIPLTCTKFLKFLSSVSIKSLVTVFKTQENSFYTSLIKNKLFLGDFNFMMKYRSTENASTSYFRYFS